MEELHIISNPLIKHPLKSMFINDVCSKFLKEKGFNMPCFAYYQLSHTSDDYKFYMVGEYLNGYNDYYTNYVGIGLTNNEMERNPVGMFTRTLGGRIESIVNGKAVIIVQTQNIYGKHYTKSLCYLTKNKKQ